MAVAVDQQILAPQVQGELRRVKLAEDSHWKKEISPQGEIQELSAE